MNKAINKIKQMWANEGIWIFIPYALTVIAVFIMVMVYAAAETPRTIAEPPTETEITFDMEANRAYNADDGIIVIPANAVPVPAATGIAATSSIPANATDAALAPAPAVAAVKIGGMYTLPEDAMMQDGSIGVLSIPKIGLTVNVYDTDDAMEAMVHGLSHFKITSAWSGNIGLAGHNVNFDLTDGFFKNLHTLKPGDRVTYTTALGTRRYAVETVAEIAETDWSYLGRTEDDRITMIMCISGKPASRLVVQCVAI